MSEVYSEGARILQDKYGTRKLADRDVEIIMHDEITEFRTFCRTGLKSG